MDSDSIVRMEHAGKLAVIIGALGIVHTGVIAVAVRSIVAVDVVDAAALGAIYNTYMAGAIGLEDDDVAALRNIASVLDLGLGVFLTAGCFDGIPETGNAGISGNSAGNAGLIRTVAHEICTPGPVVEAQAFEVGVLPAYKGVCLTVDGLAGRLAGAAGRTFTEAPVIGSAGPAELIATPLTVLCRVDHGSIGTGGADSIYLVATLKVPVGAASGRDIGRCLAVCLGDRRRGRHADQRVTGNIAGPAPVGGGIGDFDIR